MASLQSRIKRENEFVETIASHFVNQIILTLDREFNQDQIVRLAPYLTSTRLKLKRMRERLAKLADRIDESALNKLERRIVKAVNNSIYTSNIEEKNAEIEAVS